MTDLKEVFNEFNVCSPALSVESYGCGHINDTFLVSASGKKYILQKINDFVFPDVDSLMENISGVTEYIYGKTKEEDRENCLRLIKTKEGKNYLKRDGRYFRVYNFIEKGVSIEAGATLKEFELSGTGFGKFQRLLNGYPAELLKETIKDFHNTEVRLRKFEKALTEDVSGRSGSVKKEAEFFLSRAEYAAIVPKLVANGSIPLRVTHNDTKINNVLIDSNRDRAVAVIDLDTVMPGSVLYDFGDSIRSGANTGAEDETDLEKVNFSLPLFEAFSKGFLTQIKDTLTEEEKNAMAFGAILMTYECGMRFLTDYLEGDVYFKIHRENHNLDRARTQIKMVSDMEKRLEEMNALIKKYAY